MMTDTPTDELEPCPFCGKYSECDEDGPTGPTLFSPDGDNKYWSVLCCRVTVHAETREGVIAAWNRRALPQDDASDRLRERLAALAHEQWSGWMKYMFEKCINSMGLEHGTVVIPQWAVERWKRQMNTPYDELSEEEKESDRVEADRVLAVLDKGE